MKTKLLFLATFFSSVSTVIVHAQTTYVWDYANTLQNEWMQKICTQGLDTVYIVGRNGLIAKSTDRTSTWTKQYPVTLQLNDIIFCNHTTGFIVGNNGVMLRTTTAGLSWDKINCGVTSNLNAIAATGTDNIWAVGDSGKVVYSTNAGVTWQMKDFSTLANLNDISFLNTTGYIVGNTHTCFFSSDKGNNWQFKNIAVEQQYVPDRPAIQFDLLSVNQTVNHTCILYGLYERGMSINVDNNNTIFAWNIPYTNFTMKNDSIGYGFSGDCTTGSSGCGIFIQIININKVNPYSSIGFGLSTLSSFDIQHSDINFVNDSIEYIVSGSSLFHLKKYISDIRDGLNNLYNKKISVSKSLNKLTIKFENEEMDKIELYSISGLKILSENINRNETSKNLNITDLSKGIYIIRAYFRDNTSINTKWIKQ